MIAEVVLTPTQQIAHWLHEISTTLTWLGILWLIAYVAKD